MAPIEYPIFSIAKTEYTFEEAIEIMKIRDSIVTNPNERLIWRDVRTGREVIIGYTEK